jgi:hypothetical protein
MNLVNCLLMSSMGPLPKKGCLPDRKLRLTLMIVVTIPADLKDQQEARPRLASFSPGCEEPPEPRRQAEEGDGEVPEGADHLR